MDSLLPSGSSRGLATRPILLGSLNRTLPWWQVLRRRPLI